MTWLSCKTLPNLQTASEAPRFFHKAVERERGNSQCKVSLEKPSGKSSFAASIPGSFFFLVLHLSHTQRHHIISNSARLPRTLLLQVHPWDKPNETERSGAEQGSKESRRPRATTTRLFLYNMPRSLRPTVGYQVLACFGPRCYCYWCCCCCCYCSYCCCRCRCCRQSESFQSFLSLFRGRNRHEWGGEGIGPNEEMNRAFPSRLYVRFSLLFLALVVGIHF